MTADTCLMSSRDGYRHPMAKRVEDTYDIVIKYVRIDKDTDRQVYHYEIPLSAGHVPV